MYRAVTLPDKVVYIAGAVLVPSPNLIEMNPILIMVYQIEVIITISL